MRKMKQWILVFLCAALWIPKAALLCGAADVEHGGLQVSVEMDKEKYDPGEPITATFTVENTNAQTVTIASLEQLIPDGYRLTEGSAAAMENVDLAPNERLIMSVTFEGDETVAQEETEPDFFTKLVEGKTFGIPNLLLAVLAVIAVVIFMLLT